MMPRFLTDDVDGIKELPILTLIHAFGIIPRGEQHDFCLVCIQLEHVAMHPGMDVFETTLDAVSAFGSVGVLLSVVGQILTG